MIAGKLWRVLEGSSGGAPGGQLVLYTPQTLFTC